MTHAFFKALLFMAAGSIIAAMANSQNIDEMSGFGKAMRFTSITLLCGGLALAAFPGTSGFFSKDEILAYAAARGGMYDDLHRSLGYVGALLTAIYTFRLVFRVLPGRALQGGAGADRHRPRRPRRARATRRPARPRTPTSASPAPSTTSPSSRWPMRVAMGVLAFLALFAGLIQVPGRRRRDHQVPRPGLRRLAAGRDRALDRRRLGRPGDRRA